MSPSLEEALILLRKARDNEQAARELARSPSSASWIVGFHAQQAIEKAFKAVLASREVVFPRTHNLAMLATLLRNHGVATPLPPTRYAALTPFGAVLRYDDVSDPHDVTLDIAAALATVEITMTWAERAIEMVEGSQST